MARGNVVYLAGPMNNVAEFNRPAFNEVEKELQRDKKYIVINPAKLPIGLNYDAYMPICFAMIAAADMLCLLDGWQHSPGAKLEKRYAEYRGLPIYRYVDGEMLDLLK